MADECWANLVRLYVDDATVVNIITQKFTIGRSPDCDLSFPENKLVSLNHCEITKNDDGGMFLEDTSTNGTLVEGNKVKRSKVELHNGDEIHLVFKKNGTQNIAFTFEVTADIPKESVGDTLEYNDLETEFSSDDVDAPAEKKIRLTSADDVSVTDSGLQSDDNKDQNIKIGESNEVEETLLCSICQELLHQPVSLQPCLHTFCAGCFSGWLKTTNKTCPTCRSPAHFAAHNHLLRNLIAIYLKANPDKQRPQSVIDELDSENIITDPIMKLSRITGSYGDNDVSDYSDEEDSEDDSSDNYLAGAFRAPPPIFGLGVHHIPSSLNRNIPVCRECPGYNARLFSHPVTPGTIHGASAHTPAVSANGASGATATPFQCAPGNQRHIVCYCCIEPFPDRRNAIDTPVTCTVCDGIFCHQYWGCGRPSCRGCLAKLKDLNFDPLCLDTILLTNTVESGILKDYLQTKSLTITDMLTTVCSKLDSGEFSLDNEFGGNFAGKNVKGDTMICYKCGMKAMRQIAYYYRNSIVAPSELPDAVTGKVDCYWGKNCRTQKRPHHAQKFNHICEQTRSS